MARQRRAQRRQVPARGQLGKGDYLVRRANRSAAADDEAATQDPVEEVITAQPDAMTPEAQRALVVRRLGGPGEHRLRLLAELEGVDTTLRPLVAEAVRAGLPYRRIAELTGISRATVGRWAKT